MQIKLFLTVILVVGLFSSNIFSQEDKTTSDPKEIINKYISAIGGEDNLRNIKDRTTIMRGTAMEQTITLIIKQKSPNKFRQEIKVAGMDQVMIFDGEKAIMKFADQKIEIGGEQLEQLKIESAMELLLNPAQYEVTFSYEGTETVNEKLCHILKMTSKSGVVSLMYFDDETGFKILEKKTTQTQMGAMDQVVEYSDYKEVAGVKFPHKLKQSFGPQSVEVTVSSIKINTNLSDDIFVISE